MVDFSRIVVVGSIGFDHVMELGCKISDYILPEKIDRLNVSFTVDTMRKEFGGTGGNCAYTLGLLGIEPVLVGAWGHDAEAYREHLEAVGVNLGHVLVDPNVYSAWGHVMTDINENQMWMYYPGALKRMSEIDLKALLQPRDIVVLMPSEPKAYVKHLHQLVEERAAFVFDPAFFVPNLSPEELTLGIDHAAIVIGNDYEIELMQQKTGKTLQDWLRDDLIVIETEGDKGSTIWQGNEFFRIPTVQVESAHDPTGAGDTYRAGFLAGFVKNLPLAVCGRMGSLAAAYCVEKPGTQVFGYSMDEFKARYKESFGEELGI